MYHKKLHEHNKKLAKRKHNMFWNFKSPKKRFETIKI